MVTTVRLPDSALVPLSGSIINFPPHKKSLRHLTSCHLPARMTDEESRALAVKTVAAVFMSIATISVMLRCYVRGWLVKAFGWDDGSMVLAAVIHPFRRACNDKLMI